MNRRAGVDVELRQQLWRYVKTLNRNGVTVLLTTHYLEEAEAMCDTIAIIKDGAIIACEPTRQLLGRLDRKEIIVTLDRDVDSVPPSLGSYMSTMADRRTLVIAFKPSVTPARKILADVEAAGLGIVDLSTREADLEDVFIRLTQKSNAGGDL